MEIYVACDVCGHRYVLPDERMGRSAKCKSCGVSFAIKSDNFYDPETLETDEDEEEDGEEGSAFSPVWDIARKVGHALAGLVTLAMLFWMSTLLFRSPQDALAQHAERPANTVNPQQQQPSFRPNVTPQFPQPNVTPSPQVTIPKPPVTDGSAGWPQGPAGPQVRPSGPTPPALPDYRIGQPIQVLKDGSWVRAVIRQVESNGNLRVLYLGRPRGQEESVPRDRVRKQ